MKNSTPIYLLLPLLLLLGCARQAQQTTKSTGTFYTPTRWEQPIHKMTETEPQPIAGQIVPSPSDTTQPDPSEQMVGIASWYGPGFHGKETANGERYDQKLMTAAHKILPMDTMVEVHNLDNDKKVTVRINDRGPYKKDRIIDLTEEAATRLGYVEAGTASVRLKVLSFPSTYDPAMGLEPYKQFVVQIAVFKEQDRAKQFQERLISKFASIPFLVDLSPQGAYHVIAGPYNEKEDATPISEQLKKEGIENFVRSYRK